MFSYLIRRLLYTPLIIFGVMLVTFFIFFVVQKPETMARSILGKRATPQTIHDWLEVRGYDKPLFLNTAAMKGQPAVLASGEPSSSKGAFDTIFFNQMWKLMTFDLGVSDVTGRDLKSVFAEGAIPSLSLMMPAYVAGFLMATGFALYLVFVRQSALDTAGVIICVALMSVPPMVYVIFGQAVVALGLNYFPAFGFVKDWSALRFLLLPISLVIVIHLGNDVRLYRAVFLEEISQDYVRTAQAKGVPGTRLLLTHVLKNGMIALITLVVANLPILILGSLLVENFFGIPGLGGLLVSAIQTSDLAVVRATTFLTAILYIHRTHADGCLLCAGRSTYSPQLTDDRKRLDRKSASDCRVFPGRLDHRQRSAERALEARLVASPQGPYRNGRRICHSTVFSDRRIGDDPDSGRGQPGHHDSLFPHQRHSVGT